MSLSQPLIPRPGALRHQLGKAAAMKVMTGFGSVSLGIWAYPASVSSKTLSLSRIPGSTTQILAASLLSVGVLSAICTLWLHGKSSNEPSYENEECWFAYENTGQKKADLFYAHPTTHAGLTRMNMSWEDIGGTCTGPVAGDPDLLVGQAAAFSEEANVYAPKYRQMGFLAQGKDLETTNEHLDAVEASLNMAAGDLERAFRHFLLKRPDKTRPIIIAGHSQGAILLSRVIATCLQGSDQQHMLVAAYLCGGYFPLDLFGAVITAHHACRSPTDTNCIIAFDTRTPEFKPESLNKIVGKIGLWAHNLYWLLHGRYCARHEGTDDVGKARLQINPGTWTNENGGVHLGASMTSSVARPPRGHVKDEPLVAPKGWAAGTKVNFYSVCVREDVEEWWPGCSKHGNLHPIEVQFWFYNIRENVKERLAAWFALQKR